MLGVWPRADRWEEPNKLKVDWSSGGAKRDALLPSPCPCIPVLGQTDGSGAFLPLKVLLKAGKRRSVWAQSGPERRNV